MTDSIEVLITSEASARFWSACVWDIETGNALHTYRSGAVITPNTLKLINNDYIIAAECLKPLLHVWPINSQEIVKNVRLVCPGRVTALDISTDGNYCAAGIAEQLYIWQISSGHLLGIASKHFQPITKVLFTSDSSYIVTSGEDGLVLIWSLAHLISRQSNVYVRSEQIDPLHTISDHSLVVRDMYIGKGGHHGRLVTISADRTMKIYQLASKNLLLSVVFDVCLTAVTMNLTETNIYVGATDGNIFEVSLLNPPRSREYHMEKEGNIYFKGHTKAIASLSVSLNGQILASGSLDQDIIIWHIQTKQKIRRLPHKAAINNAFFTLTPKNMFVQDLKPTTIINSFSRSLLEDQTEEIVEVFNNTDQKLPFNYDTTVKFIPNKESNSKENDLISEIEKLKAINAKLYKFTLNKIIEEPKLPTNQETSSRVHKRKRKCKEN